MFNKKQSDNVFYPVILVVAVLAFVLVGFQAGGELTMDTVEAERAEARERAQESDADTEATDDGDWEEQAEEANAEAEEETDADTEATDDGDW